MSGQVKDQPMERHVIAQTANLRVVNEAFGFVPYKHANVKFNHTKVIENDVKEPP